MKDVLGNHWEKIVLLLALGLLGWTWVESQAIKELIADAQTKYKQTLQQVETRRTAQIDPDEKQVERPGIDKRIKDYFSNAATGQYMLPTSPSAGFETLAKVTVQEGKDVTVTLRFQDEDLRERLGNLTKEGITCKVLPEDVVDFKLLGGSQVKFTGLKYGKATFNIKDRALNGAKFEINVIPTLKFFAWYDKTSLVAKADENNLNLVHVSWVPGKFSHSAAGLGGVQGYTLQRRSCGPDDKIDKADWVSIDTWTTPAPTEFNDTDIFPGHQYQYRLTVDFWLKADFNDKIPYEMDPGFDPSDKQAWIIKKNETREYAPSETLRINSGIEIIGFTDVQDAGDLIDDKRNRIPRLVIRKWHTPANGGPSKWIAAWVTLPRLEDLGQPIFTKKDIREALEAGGRGLLPVVIQQKMKDPLNPQNKNRIEIEFKTDYVIHQIKTFPKGEEVKGALNPAFIDPKELELFSSETEKGKRILNEDTYAFYTLNVKTDERRIFLAQKWRGAELQKLVKTINQKALGAPDPEPTPEPEPTPDQPSGDDDDTSRASPEGH